MAKKPAKKSAPAPKAAKAVRPKAPAKKAAAVKKSAPPKPPAKSAKKTAPAPKNAGGASKKPAPTAAKAKPNPPDVKSKKTASPKPAPSSSKSPSKTSKPATPAKPTPPAKTAPAAAAKHDAKTNGKTVKPVTKVPVAAGPSASSQTPRVKPPGNDGPEIIIKPVFNPTKLPPFYKKQQQRLIELRSALSDLMEGMTRDTLRARPEGSDASVGGMHMGDAGSDAYDRDFALSMLTKEQDALYEINEALDRMSKGVYGVCELSGKKIPEERLEALPYTRYTREMQEQIERDQMGGSRFRRPIVRSVFGLDDESEGDDDDEEGETKETSPTESSLDFMKE